MHNHADYLQVEFLMTGASNAILAGNYALAEQNAVAAQALCMALPTANSKGGMAGVAMEYTPENINEFLKNVRRLAQDQATGLNDSTGGMVLQPFALVTSRCADAC